MDTDLDIKVKQLLEGRRGGWQAVAEGAGVSYSWLSKFANGHIDNPGFATLKVLFEYLTATALPLLVHEPSDRRHHDLRLCPDAHQAEGTPPNEERRHAA